MHGGTQTFAFGLLGAMSTGGVKAHAAASTLSLALRFRAQNRLEERDAAITTELVPDPSEKHVEAPRKKKRATRVCCAQLPGGGAYGGYGGVPLPTSPGLDTLSAVRKRRARLRVSQVADR